MNNSISLTPGLWPWPGPHRLVPSRFTQEKRAAAALGNRPGVTSAGLREVVDRRDPRLISDYLLHEMGLSATVGSTPEGIFIGVQTKQAFAAIWSALRCGFACAGAMTVDGRQAILVKNNLVTERMEQMEEISEPQPAIRFKMGA